MHRLAVQSLTILFFLVLNLTVPGYGVGLPTSLRVILKYHCIYSLSSTPSSPSTRLSHRLDQFIDLCFHFPRQVYPTINSTNLSPLAAHLVGLLEACHVASSNDLEGVFLPCQSKSTLYLISQGSTYFEYFLGLPCYQHTHKEVNPPTPHATTYHDVS